MTREISIPKVIIGLAVVMLISVAFSGAETATSLTDVTVSTTDGATHVAITTGGTPKYHATLIDPRRLVIVIVNPDNVRGHALPTVVSDHRARRIQRLGEMVERLNVMPLRKAARQLGVTGSETSLRD